MEIRIGRSNLWSHDMISAIDIAEAKFRRMILHGGYRGGIVRIYRQGGSLLEEYRTGDQDILNEAGDLLARVLSEKIEILPFWDETREGFTSLEDSLCEEVLGDGTEGGVIAFAFIIPKRNRIFSCLRQFAESSSTADEDPTLGNRWRI